MQQKWLRHLTREANILCKYCVMKGIAHGPTFVFPGWGGIHNQLWTWQKGTTGIHFIWKEFLAFNDFVVQEALQNPDVIATYRARAKAICDDVVNTISRISQSVSRHSSTQDIVQVFQEFCEQYTRLGATIIMTAEETEDRMRKTIDVPSEFSLLTAVAELSIDAREELDRLHLIDFISSHEQNFFLECSVQEIKERLPYLPELQQRIQSHIDAYCWIPLNFEKEIWDMDFFIRLFQSYLRDSYDYHARIQQLESHTEETLQKREEALRRVNQETRILANLLEARSYVRLYRANMFSLAFYRAFPIITEVARRTYAPFSAVKFYTPPEIIGALLEQKELDAAKAFARKQSFAMLIEKDQYTQYENRNAQMLIARECPDEDVEEAEEIRGACAYPGLVRGRVKILYDARDMEQLGQGDVLVCNATNPDLIIAMRKAAAIVTEEGGITSHAAIVSREMKKPCVIGTKIATKIFKDGDTVEVDANLGIVRKIYYA